jgi:hypothetical protein
MKVIPDPFLMFAESRGVYLLPRQLAFCKAILNNTSSLNAVKLAEYPAETDAETVYTEHKELIEAWITEQRLDYFLVLDVHRKAAKAMQYKKVPNKKDPENEALVKLTEVDDHRTQNMGARGLTDVLGFDAPKEIVATVTATADIPEDLREKLDSVYRQADRK